MKLRLSSITLLFFILLLAGCVSPGKIPYMKDIETLSQQQLSAAATVYEAKVMPKDILSIVVSTARVTEAAAPFNVGGSEYIVESDGHIEFPVIGRIRVEGMTRYEIQELVKNLLYPKYITEDPLVKVRFINYKITILGEVRAPGSYTVDKEKCSIFDALAYAGDLGIYAKRNNVLLMREDGNGEKSFYRINLQDKDLVLYPSLFYLQQNDLIYVEPSAQVATSTSINWVYSLFTMGTSILFYVLTWVNK